MSGRIENKGALVTAIPAPLKSMSGCTPELVSDSPQAVASIVVAAKSSGG